jgi:hypothetical protein
MMVIWMRVRVIVGYSRYSGPPNVKIIRETLKSPKATTRVEYNFSSSFLY